VAASLQKDEEIRQFVLERIVSGEEGENLNGKSIQRAYAGERRQTLLSRIEKGVPHGAGETRSPIDKLIHSRPGTQTAALSVCLPAWASPESPGEAPARTIARLANYFYGSGQFLRPDATGEADPWDESQAEELMRLLHGSRGGAIAGPSIGRQSPKFDSLETPNDLTLFYRQSPDLVSAFLRVNSVN